MANQHDDIDLYGNEEGAEYAGDTDAQELTKTELKSESTAAKEPASSSTLQEKPAAAQSNPAAPAPPISGAPIQSYTSPLPNDSKPPYVPQGTQQIPTYQQPSNYENQDAGFGQQGGYGASERSVRPSEMKDEG